VKEGNEIMEGAIKRWILGGAVAVTLVFWAGFNDPFNAPKSWLISISGFWIIGWLLFQRKRIASERSLTIAATLSLFFVLSMTIDLLITDNKYVGFFGEYGRRTGYIEYISLIAFFLASAIVIDGDFLETLTNIFLVLGFVIGIYGFLQHFHIDFISWNTPFNSITSYFGNPDFAAAAMAIFLILNFGLIIYRNSYRVRVIACFNVVLLAITIAFSRVLQGVVASILGVSVIGLIWLYQRNRSASLVFAGLGFMSLIMGIAGTLNVGPLRHLLYKSSVAYRGDYWRAGWRMFITHPWFGVGLDRYGANFRLYRDQTQVLRRGPDIVSNAAHNVIIQIAATGGIVLLIPYTALIGFIAWRAVVAIKMARDQRKILVVTLVATWIAYEAQSLISIDDLAVAIWGFIIGGAIVGTSLSLQRGGTKQPSLPSRRISGLEAAEFPLQQTLSYSFILIPFVLSIILMRSETAYRQLQSTMAPAKGSQSQLYETIALKPISYGLREPLFEVGSANALASGGDYPKAEILLKKVLARDSKNFDAANTLAAIYEYLQDFQKALPIRSITVQLDPQNTKMRQLQKSDQSKLLFKR